VLSIVMEFNMCYSGEGFCLSCQLTELLVWLQQYGGMLVKLLLCCSSTCLSVDVFSPGNF
jgi:hypothetical protein